MGIANCLDLDEALGVAGGSDGSVRQGYGLISLAVKVVDGQTPARAAGRGCAHGDIATAVDKGPPDAEAVQLQKHLIESVPLADSSKIDPHVGDHQSDGALLGIETKVAVSYCGPGRFQTLLRR